MNDITYHDSSVEGVRLFGSNEPSRPKLVKIEGRTQDLAPEAVYLQNELNLALQMEERAPVTPISDPVEPGIATVSQMSAYRAPVGQFVEQEGLADAA
jgi:hypothetical protein